GVIGVLKITTETSSAANVRRIEAITGPVAIEDLRRSDHILAEAAHVLRTQPHQVAEVVEAPDAKTLMDIADRVKGRLGESAAIVLGTAVDGRVHLVAAVTPALVERGVRAGEVVKVAAQVAGGGGGGRDTMAQAGGRDPEKLPEAIEAARAAIVDALG
ncbi:MAG TPA: DHHA1 domain-containing protein, partial [Solirubrobacteraceae bacterium]|nr:DHHA1 domain-containing protein [Solirubrobacteraceae bacterium]